MKDQDFLHYINLEKLSWQVPEYYWMCAASASALSVCPLRLCSILASWSLLSQVGLWMRCATEVQKEHRKRGNPVILFEMRRDLVLIEAGCGCATPSPLMLSQAKLISAHLWEQQSLLLQPTSCCCPSLHMALFCCLIKRVQANSTPVNELCKEANVSPFISLSLVFLDYRAISVWFR